MAALVAAILAQAGDKAAWLAAMLADRYHAGAVIAGAAVALAANYALAGAAGVLLAPIMAPRATLFLLAIALVFAGVGAAFASKAPDRLAGWRIGGVATSALGLFILAFGDSTQFIAGALAARSPLPWAAAVGATLGSLVVVVPAALMGEAAYLALPRRAIRWGTGAVLLVVGTIAGLSALLLI